MRWIQLVLVGALLPASLLAAEDESARLNRWLDQQYEAELLESPLSLTWYGRRERYAEIDDASLAEERATIERLLASADNMAGLFDYQALSPQARISYDFWTFRAQGAADQLPFLGHPYVFTRYSGNHTFPAEFLANYHAVGSEDDMLAYISRIAGLARWGDQMLDRAKVSALKGIRPPRFSYEAVIGQSGRIISGYPFQQGAGESPLWLDASAKLAGLVERGVISPEREEELGEDVRRALLEHMLPFYRRLIAWLREDIANTDEIASGVHALPEGREYYRRQLRHYTHSDMSAEEVHQLGLAEVARIRGEMDSIRRQVGFAGSLQEFLGYVRDDPRFYYPNTDEGRAAYLEDTKRYLAEMATRLPDYFGLLPQTVLEVRRVEPYREVDGEAQFYQGGTADGSRPGVYYLHLSDMTAYNRTDLESTAYHEGSPGHHMEDSITLRLTGIPLFRTHIGYSAFWEGWALYAELLAREMGAYTDPYSDFGRLVAEIWRAIRLVVDTGLHAMGWSEEQAVQYMLENSSLSELTVRSEIQRYLVAPGQAVSYKTGMLKILALREKAQAQLGDRFDIREFHDVILGGGSLPLPILERAVDAWIQSLVGSKSVD